MKFHSRSCDRFSGFRAIGCGIPLSTFSAFFINVALSGKTRQVSFPISLSRPCVHDCALFLPPLLHMLWQGLTLKADRYPLLSHKSLIFFIEERKTIRFPQAHYVIIVIESKLLSIHPGRSVNEPRLWSVYFTKIQLMRYG